MAGEELNEQLEFEERIKAMTTEDRAIFIAKQVYALTEKCSSTDAKVDDLRVQLGNINGGTSKKASAATSAITAGVIVGAVEAIKTFFSGG